MNDKVWVVLGVLPTNGIYRNLKIANEVTAKNWGEAIYVAREEWRSEYPHSHKEILVAGVVCGRTDEETKALSVF